jgi:hypothetical protein
MSNPTIGDNFDASLLREAVRADLIAKGYSALFNGDTGELCGCRLDDLMPCVTTLQDIVDDGCPIDCEYAHWHDGEAWTTPEGDDHE